MGCTPGMIERVRIAAELDDIGKMAIPEALLNKRGALSSQEWAVMGQHTVAAERIIGAAAAPADVAPVVRSSHERWDGRGYPDGLIGEQIPPGSQIGASATPTTR